MDRRMAVGTTLQYVIPDAGCWHSHANLLAQLGNEVGTFLSTLYIPKLASA